MAETIISGSRRIIDHKIVEAAIAASGFTITKVIEGGQRTYRGYPVAKCLGGVDWLAKQWAIQNGVDFQTEYAEWDTYGRKAGPIRNRKMAAIAKQLIAIPDSESTGTLDMIKAAREAGYPPERIYIHPRTTETPMSDKIQVPPPPHVKFTKEGRAYVDADHLTNAELGTTTNNPTPQPAVEQKYVYTFHLWPDETWGHVAAGDEHRKIPAAVFDLFRMINHGIEMEFASLEFVRFRHDVESFGITLREISRRPYQEEETVL